MYKLYTLLSINHKTRDMGHKRERKKLPSSITVQKSRLFTSKKKEKRNPRDCKDDVTGPLMFLRQSKSAKNSWGDRKRCAVWHLLSPSLLTISLMSCFPSTRPARHFTLSQSSHAHSVLRLSEEKHYLIHALP